MSTHPEPEPPTNVRAVHADGYVERLEVRFDGWSGGVARWVATSAYLRAPVQLEMDVLPPRTELIVEVWGATWQHYEQTIPGREPDDPSA